MKKLFFKTSTILFLSLITLFVLGQHKELDRSDKIPIDSKVKIGKLDNGLTYYIRKNEFPKDRAEFYLVVNAGAIQEEDDQNGLAHFAEHMAFNGTKHFEKHDILNYLRSIGMKFGPEINAFTSSDETNYMLQKVPTDVPENIDTALLILYDWANNISFEDEEIDKERGVIHEEWRTSRGAQFRLMTKTDKILYKGSKYAERDVIGDIEIIDNFPYETLIQFYADWYRPDLQAIIAVGDFDPLAVENKIIELFSQIPEHENPKERKIYEVPNHEETYVAIETDPEARFILVQLYYKHEPFVKENYGDYRQNIVFQLYNQMLNNRLQERLQEEDPPFIYGYSAYSNLVRSKDAYMGFAVAKNDGIKRTLETLLVENERVKRHGFNESELERAKRVYLSQLEKQYNERDKQESQSYVWTYYSHFLQNEPTPGIEFDYAFARNLLPGITVNELNELAPRWITSDNRVVVITAPEREDVVIPMKDEILAAIELVEQMDIEPYVDKIANRPLIAEIPTPGSIDKIKKNKKLGTQEWLLSNGIRVVLKPTDYKDDEILMRAYSYGGSSLYDIDDLMSAGFSSDLIIESGISDFDKIQLQKLLAGKVVSVNPYISSSDEGFSGSASKKNLETMFQLIYLYFTQARAEEKAFNAYMTRIKGFFENRKNDPAAAFSDTITVTMANYNPRVRPLTVELLEEVEFNRAKFIFKERFGDPSSFTFYFVGNINLDSIKPLIETYLGSLPKVTRNETWKDNGVRPPKDIIEKTVIKEMKVPKGTVYITYTGEYDFNDYENRLKLTSLCDILDIRYTESIREEQGGTYGVAVYRSQNQYPYEHYQVMIRFDCDPENVDKLKAIVYEEIEKLKKDGPLDKDLHSVTENKLKTRKENLERNNYWADKLKSLDYENDNIKDFLKYEKYVKKLSKESLQEAAVYFFGDNHVEIILLPENPEDNVKNPMTDK